jgi:hypothetical protein
MDDKEMDEEIQVQLEEEEEEEEEEKEEEEGEHAVILTMMILWQDAKELCKDKKIQHAS